MQDTNDANDAKDANEYMRKDGVKGRMRDRQRRRALYDMIITLSTYEECCNFFDDLCTGKELEALEQRFEVAKMLSQEKVYLDIMKSTGASSATISRVKRMLSDGTGCLKEKINNSLEEEA